MSEQARWKLINPEGTTELEPFVVNPHCQTLEGKTVLLFWNGKHNGDVFLGKLADLLARKVNDLKLIRSWEVAPETAISSTSLSMSKEKVSKLADYKPDIVIGSQAD